MPNTQKEPSKEKIAELCIIFLSSYLRRIRFGPVIQDMEIDQVAEKSRILDIFKNQWNNGQCDSGNPAERIHDLPHSKPQRWGGGGRQPILETQVPM